MAEAVAVVNQKEKFPDRMKATPYMLGKDVLTYIAGQECKNAPYIIR